VADPAKVSLNQERIKHWIGQGAIPTDTVKNILKKQGVFAAPT
jgi:small subunit ribosomal protein S16